MKYLLNTSTDPHRNMAFDEFALEALTLPEPVFYLWQNAPSVIIGLNQSPYAEVNLPFLQEKGIILARRVTGGGAVYHDWGNLNYSIVGSIRAMENAFEWVPEALCALGVPARRTGRNDILVDGRKCSGYAKRLSRGRMMIHGTLMWDVDLQTLTEALRVPGSKVDAAGVASVTSRVANLKDYLPQYGSLEAFREALHALLSAGDGPCPLPEGADAEIERLRRDKFGRWEWIYGHAPESTHCKRQKFACGTIEVHYSLKRGVLSEVSFLGDFIGNRPADELAGKLSGLRLEELRSVDVGAYFDGLSARDFASLFQD
ncbi:MAG: lipoate--protein ligase [Bacteroidales bacterium]|nr:lipoate--protein ligase [Bacteroidales bacterium]